MKRWKTVSNPMRNDGVFLCEDGPPRFYENGSPQLPEAVVPMQLTEAVAEKIAVAHNKVLDSIDAFTHGMCDYSKGPRICILTKGHVERAKTPHTDAEGVPMGPVKEPPLLQCVACRNTESCAGAMAREHWHPGLCMHCGGAFRVVRA